MNLSVKKGALASLQNNQRHVLLLHTFNSRQLPGLTYQNKAHCNFERFHPEDSEHLHTLQINVVLDERRQTALCFYPTYIHILRCLLGGSKMFHEA